MIYGAIAKVLGLFFLAFSVILLVPLGISTYYDFVIGQDYLQVSSSIAFGLTALVSLFVGGVFWWAGRKTTQELRRKESILLVVSIWFLTAAVSALPFLITQTLSNPVDAYFEAMSAMTTTGATVIEAKSYDALSGKEIPSTLYNPLHPDIKYTFYGTIAPLRDPTTGIIKASGIEALGKPLIFWRAFLAWLGGIGVVVLFVAILPALSLGGKFLYETEIAGPSKEGITPRIKETAAFLWKVYVALTFVLFGCIAFSDSSISFFDSIILTFGTISTGGYYSHSSCLSMNLKLTTTLVIIVFMIIGGTNFSLFFHCIKRRVYKLKDPELFAYLMFLIVASLMMTAILFFHEYPLKQALYFGVFQSVSTITSTGFSFVDYDSWPMPAQILIIMFMYVGGMSGSTSGGIKVIRYLIAGRTVINKIESFFRPEVIRVIRIGNKEISEKTSSSVLTFFFLMIFFVVLGTFLLVLSDIDPLTAIGIISSTINNSGLYFGGIGCTSSLGFLSDYAKIISILWMVLGRLEFLSLLVLLAPAFWRSR